MMIHNSLLKVTFISAISVMPLVVEAGMFDQFQKQMQSVGKNNSADPARNQSFVHDQQANNSVANNAIEESCRGIFGSHYQKAPLGGISDEQLVSRYFTVTPDLDAKLYDGINVWHKGSFNQLTKKIIEDLEDDDATKLGHAFKENPSVSMLAQVIYQSEHADAYEPENDSGETLPSSRAEMKTLLAMILLQYPDLLKYKQAPVEILKSNSGNSKLRNTMMARFYLYGDYKENNIDIFSNYIAQGSGIKTADATVVWAIQNVPDWKNRRMYQSLMNSSKSMQASLNRQREAAAGSSINKRAIQLMKKGEEIDQLTAQALGIGDEVAKIRATGELMQKEATGEDNRIKILASQNEESSRVIRRHLSAETEMDSGAKKKFEKANKLRMENHADLVSIQSAVAMKFFTEGFGEALNSGPYINQYFRASCKTTMTSMQYANKVGVVVPTQSVSDMADEL